MSSNSIFTSVNSEKIWVLEINRYFPKLPTNCCVFKVPKTLIETKPEAYTPEKIGLGPYHHLQPDLYRMHKQKLDAVTSSMNQDNLNNVHKVVEALIDSEPLIRACYDHFLDFDAKTLAWIVAIDSLYLIQFLRNLRKTEIGKPAMDATMLDNSDNWHPEIEKDIIKLENQIPTILLKKILQFLGNDDHTLLEDLDFFCQREQYSPLEHSRNSKILQDQNQDHLLHRLYHLIVSNGIIELDDSNNWMIKLDDSNNGMIELDDSNSPMMAEVGGGFPVYQTINVSDSTSLDSNNGIIELDDSNSPMMAKVGGGFPVYQKISVADSTSLDSNNRIIEKEAKVGGGFPVYQTINVADSTSLAPAQGDQTNNVPASTLRARAQGGLTNMKALVDKVPWGEIKALLKKHDPDYNQNPSVEEIKIPSASQMFKFAGIIFTALTRDQGIGDINFDVRGGRNTFYLPMINMNIHTETILRNLVAFELSKPGLTRGFTLYVDLMAGIIDTEEDVKILKDADIIKGELPEDEIVRIFNGIRKSSKENDEGMPNIKSAIDNAIENYDDAWNVKVKRSMKKYFTVSWKCTSVVFSVVVVVLLAVQTFCSMFGCARWFGESATVKGGHFLYAYE